MDDSVGAFSHNSSEINWKIDSYFISMETGSEQKDFHVDNETVNEYSNDTDDTQSTKSSIESMDIIVYPSNWVLSEIQKLKNESVKKYINEKKKLSSSQRKNKQNFSGDKQLIEENDNHTTSSVESVDIIMYPSNSVLSKINKLKKKVVKRSISMENEESVLHTKHTKISKFMDVEPVNTNKLNDNIDFISNHGNNSQLFSEKNVQQSDSIDKYAYKKGKLNHTCDTSKKETLISQPSVKKMQKKKALHAYSKKKGIVQLKKSEKKSVKSFKIPRLSDKKLVSNTLSSKNNSEVDTSILDNPEVNSKIPSKKDSEVNNFALKNSVKCSNSTFIKQTPKKRSLDHGSHKKPVLQDVMSKSTKKYTKSDQPKSKKSIELLKKKQRTLHSSVSSQVTSEPDLLNEQLTNYTLPSKSNSEVNISVKCPNGIITNQSTVKRSLDYGSRMKCMLQDRSKPTKKDIKNDPIVSKKSVSVLSFEKNQSAIESSVSVRALSEPSTSINNSVEQNSLNTQIEFKASILVKSSKLIVNTKQNIGANTIPHLNINKPEKNLALNLSVSNESLGSEKDYEKINDSNSIIPTSLDSEKPEKKHDIKRNPLPLLYTDSQFNEHEIIQVNLPSSVSNEYSETYKKLRQNSSESTVSTSLQPNSNNLSPQILPPAKISPKHSQSSFTESTSTGNRNNCYYELIKRIVEMSPKWLHEKDMNVVLPSSITKGVTHLPLSFDSYDIYVISFLQMILLEVWETICYMSEPYLKSKCEKKFYFSVLSYQYVNGLMKLQCESIVNKDVSFCPCDKSLVILDLKEISGTWHSTFGLITNPRVLPESLEIEFMNASQWKSLPQEWLRNAKIWKFNVYVKNREISIAKNVLMEGNGICNLKDKIQLTEALNSLRFSPLVDCILSPDWETFHIAYDNNLHTNDYMNIQKEICHAVYNKMTLPNVRKIILLEGPPGSGKTEVIARVCRELIKNHTKSFKILVTAPSHFAVDNIANQMIELNHRLGSEDITFIRTGNSRFIHPKHLNHSLHVKLEKAKKNYERAFNKWMLDRERIHDKINYYQKKSSEDNKSYEKQIAQLEIKKRGLAEVKWNKMNETKAILNDVNIILSTFNDCFDLHRTKINFSCCIIDEANQATEPETLFPFMFKNSKFFILGDTKQLPAVIRSEFAIKYGFQRSILERFQAYFMEKYHKSPAIQLKMQFRMHGDISIFPLKTFYFEDYNPPSYSYSFKICPLKPYIVFDDISDLNSQINSLNDKFGCTVITDLCLCVTKYCPVTSTAIIVPSVTQKSLYHSALVKKLEFSNIEVDTIESFQGREKSICILSCYHESIFNNSFPKIFSCKRTMNVALTRASHSLIICGPIHLLKVLPYWKALINDSKARHTYISYSHGENISDIFKKIILK